MNISMYEACVPVFARMLRNLQRILAKGAAHAEANGVDPALLLASRLHADMYPLAKQVQIAADAAMDGAARLVQREPPRWEDTEQSFADLDGRLAATITWLEALDPAAFVGAEDRMVVRQARGQTFETPGMTYLLHHALPKFYFHVTTTYAILRHEGVDLRKGDYMGKI
jgi:hypothetical protein